MVIIIVVIVIVVLLYAFYSKNKKNKGSEYFQAIHNEIERLGTLLNESHKEIEKLKDAPSSSNVVRELVETHDRLKSSLTGESNSLKKNKDIDVNNVHATLKKISEEIEELQRKTHSVKKAGSASLKASQGGKVTISNTPYSPKPSYTIQNIPFLPKNEITIDYSTQCRVKYTIGDSLKEDFPIIRAPRYGSYIKYPVTGRAGKRGASEEYFCNKIVEFKLQDHFYDNISLFVKDLGFPYEPDLAYIDVTKGVFLDIEIDEPYTGWDREPIHYKTVAGETIDDLRNKRFTERGWTVIRFSENQIREQTLSCLKSIFELLQKMDKNMAMPVSLKDGPELKPDRWWTKEEAKRKADKEVREKLLGISEFIPPKNDATASLGDYKEGKFVEDKIIEYKDDLCWEECKHQKDYKRYIRCSYTSKYINEAKKLQQDKERQEKLEQQAIKKREELEEKQAQEARRREDVQRARDAQRYERQTVTTSTPPTRTQSSRGYA